jgi:hypothetical protein
MSIRKFALFSVCFLISVALFAVRSLESSSTFPGHLRKGKKSMAAPAIAKVAMSHPPVRFPFIIYGTAWKKERTKDLVIQAVKAGFRAVDTACQV